MYTVIAVCVAFLTVLAHCGISYSQTGIERVPAPNGSLCSDILMYTCVTTGRGAAEFNVSTSFLRIRHSQYRKGTPDETVRNSSDHIVMAGNLLKSDSNDSCCDTVCDFCYTAELTIPVTEETMCKSITCGTLGDNGTTVFETALVERIPRPPYDLRVVNQSTKGFTAAWMPEIADCPSARFEVTITNCDSCSSTIIVTHNNITMSCEGQTANHVCRISVRSLSECGTYSEPAVMTVQLLEVTPPSKPVDNETNKNIAFGVVFGFIGVVIIILPTIAIIAFLFQIVYRRRKRFAPPSNASSHQQIVPATQAPQEDETPLNIVPGPPVSQEAETLNNTQSRAEAPQEAESSLNGINHQAQQEDQSSLNNTSPLAESDVQIGDTSCQQLIPRSDDDQECATASSSKAKTVSGVNDKEVSVNNVSDLPPPESESTGGEKKSSTMIVNVPPPGPSMPMSAALPRHPLEETAAEPTADFRVIGPTELTSDSAVQLFIGHLGSKPGENDEPSISDVTGQHKISDEPGGKPPPDRGYSTSERGHPLSQALSQNDSEGEVQPKKKVKVVLNGTGSQTNTNRGVDVQKKIEEHDERFARLEKDQDERFARLEKDQDERFSRLEKDRDEDRKEIKELKDEISRLSRELEEVRSERDALQNNCTIKDQCIERLSNKVDDLEKRLAQKEKELEEARKAPRKALSTETKKVNLEPPVKLLRVKSCPDPPNT